MIKKAILAASVATGLVVPAKAGVYLPPKPAIIKPENIEFSKNILAMPFTLGMLPRKSAGPLYVSGSNYNTAAPTATANLSWSHTVPSGTSCLVIAACWIDSAGPTTSNSASWNGTALTRCSQTIYSANNIVEIYYLLNPTAGTFTAQALYAGSIDRFAAAVAINLSGVTAFDVQGGTTGASGGTKNIALTTTAKNVIVIAAFGANSTATVPTISCTAPASSTSVGSATNTSSSSGKRFTVFVTPQNLSGSITTTTSSSANTSWASSAAAFK